MSEFADAVREKSDSAGTGTSVHLTGAYNDSSFSMDEAGAIDGKPYSFVIEQGADREYHYNKIWNATARTFPRDTPLRSKVGGIAGVAKINLNGTQTIRVVLSSRDLYDMRRYAKRQAIIFG